MEKWLILSLGKNIIQNESGATCIARKYLTAQKTKTLTHTQKEVFKNKQLLYPETKKRDIRGKLRKSK